MTAIDKPAILWFRQDLRLDDHPALHAAAANGRGVQPVFFLDDAAEGEWAAGGAGRWWLHHSLEALGTQLRTIGAPLLLRRGATADGLVKLAQEVGAGSVHCSQRFDPAGTAQEECVRSALASVGVSFAAHAGALLHDPAVLRTGSGVPYKVYTPFAKSLRAHVAIGNPLPAPRALRSVAQMPAGSTLESLNLLPTVDWAGSMRGRWTPGELGAQKRLAAFMAKPMRDYGEARDIPAQDGSSSLSPHMHWGEISPRRVWSDVSRSDAGTSHGASKFLAEILWREFAAHVLLNFPATASKPLRPEFAKFPWQPSAQHLRAWQRGQTGYPIVDAGMRQLWATGWMHNRVRMIVASFLVKHLLQSWQEGARWFWDTLCDADLASNTLGWQWSAGCGADAAPYFRIFNPILQGEKFDPDGEFVRRWVPELAKVPSAFIHQPWEAPPMVLASSGVLLGETYPQPIVDHPTARDRALAALQKISSGKSAARE